MLTNWVYLPQRATALNLARTTRIEFYGGAEDAATVYFDHAEGDDAEVPEWQPTAYLPIHGRDTDALRTALGLPTA